MKIRILLILAVCMGFLAAACSTQGDLPGVENPEPFETPPQTPITPLEPGEAQANLVEIKDKYEKKVAQDNTFAFDLLRTTAKYDTEPNLLVSPLSVTMALNMTLNGAVGETRDEMLTALRVAGYTPKQVNDYSNKLLQALRFVSPNTGLSVANSIWYRQGFPVLKPFIETNRKNYYAAIEAADFADPATLGRINAWIAENTGGRIDRALDEISAASIMYLINTIYFNGMWKDQFYEDFTSAKPFRNNNGAVSNVPTMRMTTDMMYGQDDLAAYLELPFSDNETHEEAFSMVVALPNEGKTAGELVQNLTTERWNAAMAGMADTYINLELPRFKFEGDYRLEEKILPEMGMRRAFTGAADFSLLSSEASTCISRVIHKTFIDVTENGAEAGAVTIVSMDVSAGDGPLPKPVEFHVDRPFMFAIKENTTGLVIFIGSVGEIK